MAALSRLTGELALIEPAGPLHYLDVDVAGQMVKATCADPDGLSPGASVTLSAPASGGASLRPRRAAFGVSA